MEAIGKLKKRPPVARMMTQFQYYRSPLKRKLPAAEFEIESARQKSPPPLQSCPSVSDSKRVSEWSVDEVKAWVMDMFGIELIAKNFEDEEIDGRILLSSTVRTNEAMERLGLTTIGKRGKFLEKTKELAGNSQAKASTFNSTSDSATILHPKTDRLLTQHEKKQLTCENKRIYNTKKKMIAAEINKEWPLVEEVPSFRPHHNEEVQKLNEFVKRLSEGKESSKYTFEECGLGQNAIREIVLMQNEGKKTWK
ncbi:hypothetical protein OS493_037085 [Desmophyllum pertusum]|uniref:SAM domain-containing protein n=1 Tax=Desmophyllum pertusum TaxID=174260 RepID=A0A9X0CWK7_9CNID|nr:hypothetical protein OS493_037085 [Desmophyllum pertusum]